MGFEGRARTYSLLKNGKYHYGVADERLRSGVPTLGTYSFIIPGFFIHRAYLEMLFDPSRVPTEFIKYVDEVMNCDDLLMSMMVAKFQSDNNSPWGAGLVVAPVHPIQEVPSGGCELALLN